LLFTVFTPVYNRRERIHRVWDSLRAQTFRDFEWVVVDDGSTDNVMELLEQYAREADFPVRLHRKENGGKHTAWNLGAQMARGELFVPLDHDDACVPQALERFRYWWFSIPEADRPSYSGVNVLCTDPATGQVIGTRYPASPMTSNNLELTYVYHMEGEKWGMIRTDVLREVPFPSDESIRRHYMSESYLWYNIARRYKVLCVNESLRMFYRDASDSLTNKQASATLADRLQQHLPARYYFKNWHLNADLDYLMKDKKELAKTALDVWITGLAFKGSVLAVLRDGRGFMPRLVRLAAMPAGVAAYVYCRLASSKQKSAKT
jgi:glycosyltransferase involved in cell wall biosynthesis